MRSVLAAGLAALLAAGCSTAPAPPPAPVPRLAPPPGHVLSWADEFERDGEPDPARWAHDTGRNREGWHNHELQYYGHAGGGNAVVRGGRLFVTARREAPRGAADWGGQRYTSARLITRGLAQWTYGFFEIRAKMPCGRGTWPAIWMLGTGGEWPGDGELDILEHMGRHPERASSAVHTSAASGAEANSGTGRLATACSAFHDYQMLWTREGVSFGVDGVVHWHYARGTEPKAWPFDKPQYLVLNLAIGGDLGGEVDDTIFPLAMEVEYVRVWQAKDAAR